MISRSTLVHFRLPFFFFLSPVFLFSLVVSPHPDLFRTLLAFFILHFLVYPASNAFNSWFDRDTTAIGGVECPPVVTPDLPVVVNVMDLLAIGLGLFAGWPFAAGCAAYVVCSRLYSWDRTRLKRRPVISWLMVGLGQGTAVFLMSYYAINHPAWKELFSSRVLLAGLLPGLFLLAAYPLTQVYQHEADRDRGDASMSMLLGVEGTFRFALVFFSIVTAGYCVYLYCWFGVLQASGFVLFLAPLIINFLLWYGRVRKDLAAADFRSLMRQNLLSALCLNSYFILLFVYETWARGKAGLPG